MIQGSFESWLYGEEDEFPEGMNGDADLIGSLILPAEPDLGGFRLEPENPHNTNTVSDIDLSNWKNYPAVVTNSLWVIRSRSQAGMHSGHFHGNFIPQIPFQAMARYTKRGDVVLDPFLGSGTTLIQCKQMGRHGIGIELSKETADDTRVRVNSESNTHNIWTEVIDGDSTDPATFNRVREILDQHNKQSVQLVIMHPPYHDIIRFTDDPDDLSNAPTLQAFLEGFGQVVDNSYDLLDEGHFLVVVIGDKYSKGEWIPLGFETMRVVQESGFGLKSIVVKNMEGNRAKRNLENLWRRRALQGGFYIFKHEYVLFFEKMPNKDKLTRNLMQVCEYIRAMDKVEGHDLLDGGWRLNSITQLAEFEDHFRNIDLARILLLRNNVGIVQAVLIDLVDQELTDGVVDDLQQIIARLQPDAVEVYAIASEIEQRAAWEIEGITFIYPADAIAYAARGMYTVRKTTGWRQRTGKKARDTFSENLYATLATHFAKDDDSAYSNRQELAFRFFKDDSTAPFRSARAREPNFEVGIAVKWIKGHETEKLPQIRDKYFGKGYTLVAVVGPNTNTWQNAISGRWGDFADYYLFVEKGAESDLANMAENRHLWHTVNGELVESTHTLLSLLKEKKDSTS